MVSCKIAHNEWGSHVFHVKFMTCWFMCHISIKWTTRYMNTANKEKRSSNQHNPFEGLIKKLNWYFDELLLQVMMIYCIFIIIDYLSISFALKREVSAESVDMMMSFFFSLRHHFHHIRLIFVDFIFVHCHTINERGIRSFLIEKDCFHLQRINHKL